MKKIANACLLAASGWLVVGCATSKPPPELIDARNTYQRVSSGPTRELDPKELAAAKESLDRAEFAFDNGYDYYYTRDVAYIAKRKAELAEVQGKMIAAQREHADANQRLAELEALEAKRKLEASRPDPVAKNYLEKLSKVAEVRQDDRGLVLTLAGGITFDSGKSTLRPEAKKRLDQIAESLKDMGARTVVVEGYTDATGSPAVNKRLSLARATEVRTYLLQEGIPAENVRATGLGPDRPVADNKSAKGRAANRRVEIIVQRVPAS
jgi:outer membrane protein OmpA-like peptidoglycan-associated protein